MKSLQVLVLAAMTYMTSFALAFAQTAASPPVAANPAPAAGGWAYGWGWFWVVVAIIVIAGLIWYFTSRRTTDRRL